MKLLRSRRDLSAGLTAFALLASTALAGTPQPGGPPGIGPVAGPVEIHVMAEVSSSPLGDLVETDLVVENHADDPVRVYLSGRFTWPDGSSGMLRYGPPVTLDGNSALLVNALSPIPAGVGSGTGTFAVTGVVGPVGRGGRSAYPSALIARDTATFELP